MTFLAVVLVLQSLSESLARTTAAIRMRERPDTAARVVTTLRANSEIYVTSCERGWCQVSFQEHSGYVPQRYLSRSPRASGTIPRAGGAEVFATGRVDSLPEVVSGPPLEYPPELRLERIEGRVLVQAIVDTNGKAEPLSLRVLQSAHPGFNKPALDYVLAARFRPARAEGRRVRVLVNLPIDFTIRGTDVEPSDPKVTYINVLRRDLRRLESAEQEYFAKHARYTRSFAELSFQPSPGVTITFESINESYWHAVAVHAQAPGWRCEMYGGIPERENMRCVPT